MKKAMLQLLAASAGFGDKPLTLNNKGMEINKRTGVVKLSSIFPRISKSFHINGRKHNVDGRFPSIPLSKNY